MRNNTVRQFQGLRTRSAKDRTCDDSARPGLFEWSNSRVEGIQACLFAKRGDPARVLLGYPKSLGKIKSEDDEGGQRRIRTCIDKGILAAILGRDTFCKRVFEAVKRVFTGIGKSSQKKRLLLMGPRIISSGVMLFRGVGGLGE
jgi:hypothetical protein